MSQSQRWRGGRGGFSQFAKQSSRPKKPCANPIFERWITEWKEEAEVKDSNMKYVYAKALKSLRKYPLVLNSGKECGLLENFGSHMCKMIENRMIKENMTDSSNSESQSSSQGLQGLIDEAPGTSTSKKSVKTTKAGKSKRNKDLDADVIDLEDSDGDTGTSVSKPKKRKPGKQYIPAFRSGAYAILVALYKKDSEAGYRGYMTRSELIQDAQHYCEASLTKPDTTKGNHYTAWNSMKGLLAKELVIKRGSPAQYFLTPEGRELAQKMLNAEAGGGGSQLTSTTNNSEDVLVSDYGASSQDDEMEVAFVAKDVRLEPGTFEVVLYVDTCETNGRSKSQEVVNELQKNGVTVHVQRLSVGDFVWVCRATGTDSGSNRHRLTMSQTTEVMLPYVVERKRTDDLAHSIRDGRYREQKYRLLQTKLRVVYLVEAYGKGDWGLGDGALGQALCNTQVVSGFQVQETSSIKDTCAYLTFMTRHLKTLYENKVLIGRQKSEYCVDDKPGNPNEEYVMFFSDFNDFAVKKTHWNAKEMFARHLMRMKGLSVDKAFAIVQLYPTVHDLFQAYSECETERQKQLLLSAIHFVNGRKMGPSISRKLAILYNTPNLQ